MTSKQQTDPTLIPCPCCGGEARICQWKDTLDPHATWIACASCGLMTDSFHAFTPEAAKQKAAAVWNRRKA